VIVISVSSVGLVTIPSVNVASIVNVSDGSCSKSSIVFTLTCISVSPAGIVAESAATHSPFTSTSNSS